MTTLDEIRNGPPTVDLETAASLLGVSRSFAYALAKRGEFPCRLIKVGTRYRVPRPALLALLEGDPDGADAQQT